MCQIFYQMELGGANNVLGILSDNLEELENHSDCRIRGRAERTSSVFV